MQCKSCNAELPEGAAFCSECGAKVEVAPPPPEPKPAADPLLGGTIVIPKKGNEDGTVSLKPGDQFAERYEIQTTLGAGGMGVVYKAQDTVTGQPVALKLINSHLLNGTDAVDRLIDEGVVTRKIQHRNVVNVYDVGRVGNQPYLTMEYLEGEALRSWLGKQLTAGNEVSVETATAIVQAILEGLAEAHSHNVIHRDLKPENIFLLGDPESGDYRLKILDFGIARSVNASAFTSSVSALGTLPYMAPEQKTTPDAAGPSADLYSLSRLFYELLMDVLPDGPWQPPSAHRADVPKGFDALLEKGLSNRPRSRQQSVAEYQEELKQALIGKDPGQHNNQQEEEENKPPPVEKTTDNWFVALLKERLQTDGQWDNKKIAVAALTIMAAIVIAGLLEDTNTDAPPVTPSNLSQRTPETRSVAARNIAGTWFVTAADTRIPVSPPCMMWQARQQGTSLVARSGSSSFQGVINGDVIQGRYADQASGANLAIPRTRLYQSATGLHFQVSINRVPHLVHVNHRPAGNVC